MQIQFENSKQAREFIVRCAMRTARLIAANGKVTFEQDVEAPIDWSDQAVAIFASKYFRRKGIGYQGEGGENSIVKAVERVARTIAQSGVEQGYFSEEGAESFYNELLYLILTQRGSFNSPVWFNVGLSHVYGIKGTGGHYGYDPASGEIVEVPDNLARPQTSACFVASIKDDLMSIYDHLKTEAKLFKYGSGVGVNFSTLRSKHEPLSGGGHSSGLISFLKVFDSAAGATKSGGISRRAAKLVCLNVDHPEIEEFIDWKVGEEKKARALIAQGYPDEFGGEVYQTISGQNSNNSIRITDEFMVRVENDMPFETRYRTNRRVHKTLSAKEIFNKIAKATWECADPGVQFDDTINKWNTLAGVGKINASNPCQPGFATVLTPEGIRTFDDVDVGSIIWSGKRWTEITQKVFTGVKMVRKYKTRAGSFVGTENHRVIQNGERVEVKDAESIDSAFEPNSTEESIGAFITNEILEIEDLGMMPVYDLTVEAEEHTYWTGGLLVSNCSEFMSLDNTACNLASLNLLKFFDTSTGRFHCDEFEHAVRTFIIAQDILVDLASYPTAEIARNAHAQRQLGLGYANLGALLMELGLPYDSNDGRYLAGAITSLMTATAYQTSAELADCLGSFEDYSQTHVSMKQVILQHIELATLEACNTHNFKEIHKRASDVWSEVATRSEFRNSQVSLLAPCGTIGFTMDCETTGIEPSFALVAWKKLSDGGELKLINKSVENALRSLGYSLEEIEDIRKFILEKFTIEGAPHLKPEHYKVFECAAKCGPKGKQYLSPISHLKMMQAVQPFLSGSISKTINCPTETTWEEIADLYKQAWRMGLKSVAIYRDCSKGSQPLTSSKPVQEEPKAKPQSIRPTSIHPVGTRVKLPKKRHGWVQEAKIDGQKIFLRTGEYEDGTLGEIFVDIHKVGASFRSIMQCFAMAVSLGLQYGVPLEAYVKLFTFTRFEPHGIVEGHPNIKLSTSIVDYIFRVLGIEYLKQYELGHVKPETETLDDTPSVEPTSDEIPKTMDEYNRNVMNDAPICPECGTIMIRNGACYKCPNCSSSSGCS